jgi:multidrug efflux pump subunit AcrA (membrane-fusion protein)
MRGITLWFASGWLLLSACSGGEQALARAAKAPREVALHLVGTADLPRVVGVTGTLAAQEELVLGLQVGGRLQQLPVDLGDRVEAGALLAALDPRDFELELQRATAALATPMRSSAAPTVGIGVVGTGAVEIWAVRFGAG